LAKRSVEFELRSVRGNPVGASVADVLVFGLFVSLAVFPFGQDNVDLACLGAKTKHHVHAGAVLSTAPPPFVQVVPFANPLKGEERLATIW